MKGEQPNCSCEAMIALAKYIAGSCHCPTYFFIQQYVALPLLQQTASFARQALEIGRGAE